MGVKKASAIKDGTTSHKPQKIAERPVALAEPRRATTPSPETPKSAAAPAKKTSQGTPYPSSTERRKGPATRITVKYDVGFNNALYIRGKGANLNWEKGIMLKNVKPDEWVWETEAPFTSFEFKVLINDREYELGENHTISCGGSILYTPKFY